MDSASVSSSDRSNACYITQNTPEGVGGSLSKVDELRTSVHRMISAGRTYHRQTSLLLLFPWIPDPKLAIQGLIHRASIDLESVCGGDCEID